MSAKRPFLPGAPGSIQRFIRGQSSCSVRFAWRWVVACVLVASGMAMAAQPNPGGVKKTNLVVTLPDAPDLLQFADGSALHGKLQAIHARQGVVWRHPDAASAIEFGRSNLAWIRFEKPKMVSSGDKPTCRFRFTNGDELFGNLASIDNGVLELETWFGSQLKAPRSAVQTISFLSKGYSIVYEGPINEEGWVEGKSGRAWEYRDGAFVATGAGTLGRDFKLSGSSSVSFDLGWNGHFSLILALYTSTLDRFDYSSSCYMFYLSPGYMSLQRVQGGAGAMNLGQTAVPEMNRKNNMHLEIRANKEDSTLGLLIDGRLIQRWKDTAGFVGKGSGIVFFAQLDGPSIKVANLKVAQWEGEVGLESLTNASPTQDMVYLVNRDKVSGQMQRLRDGFVSFSAGETPLQIPLARVNQIFFANESTNAVPASPDALRAYFAGGGIVAFDLLEWKEGQVSGTTHNFGPIQFDAQVVRQLQFNLARVKPEGAELEILDQDTWDIE